MSNNFTWTGHPQNICCISFIPVIYNTFSFVVFEKTSLVNPANTPKWVHLHPSTLQPHYNAACYGESFFNLYNSTAKQTVKLKFTQIFIIFWKMCFLWLFILLSCSLFLSISFLEYIFKFLIPTLFFMCYQNMWSWKATSLLFICIFSLVGMDACCPQNSY